MVVSGDEVVATWLLGEGQATDMSVVEKLARWQLAARRRGYSIRLHHPSASLCELLDLAGLTEVVRDYEVAGDAEVAGDYEVAGGRLVVEVGREPKGCEQVGVEEAVEPGDTVA